MDSVITDKYAIYNGDCIEVMEQMPDSFVDYSIFSPPFADLYCYSDKDADLGNCKNYDDFFTHFGFVVEQLKRIIKAGRNISVHCIDIPAMKERDGYIGLKDFSGDLIRLFQSFGFVYHSRVTIWKDPLIEATRTKALGLMHKQLCKDSIRCRNGLPDYLLTFRNEGDNQVPVTHEHGLTQYAGSEKIEQSGNKSHHIWRAYASPVWMDIRQTYTLNARKARDEADEKHLCPLQLDTIYRGIELWSNPNETVLTPFMGVGSEVYGAVINGRKGIGIELKESYYRQAVRNLEDAANATSEITLL
jgi:DNA modification methylase